MAALTQSFHHGVDIKDVLDSGCTTIVFRHVVRQKEWLCVPEKCFIPFLWNEGQRFLFLCLAAAHLPIFFAVKQTRVCVYHTLLISFPRRVGWLPDTTVYLSFSFTHEWNWPPFPWGCHLLHIWLDALLSLFFHLLWAFPSCTLWILPLQSLNSSITEKVYILYVYKSDSVWLFYSGFQPL